MTKLYLVRHAHAGSRYRWDQPDELRPLTSRGKRQAEAVRDLLASAGLERLVSSPALRCVETLEPLAEKLGLEVAIDERLAEGAPGAGALELLAELSPGPAAACSHGDVIPDVLERLGEQGMRVKGELRWPKGSVWELCLDGCRPTRGRLLMPPS